MSTGTGTPRRFRLLQPGFHGGRYRYRGEIVDLAPGENPGWHMEPAGDAPPVVPVTVPAMPHHPAPVAPPAPVVEPQRREGVAHVASGPGFIVLDAETNGFSDPRIASFALIFVSPALEVEHEVSFFVRPAGWSMSQEATAVNGLTDEFLQQNGIDVAVAIFLWRAALGIGRRPVGHNLQFDIRVIENEYKHAGLSPPPVIGPLCTLEPARRRASSGKLTTAYKEIVGDDFMGAHTALGDARATLQLFAKLIDLGEIAP